MFTLDTNALIYALKGKGRVRQTLEGKRPSDMAVPSVVAYELEVGTLRSGNPEQRRQELKRLLSVLTVLPLDLRAAEQAASVRFDLEKAGATIGPLDTLIAGIAMAHGATLVTHNTEEFSRIPGLRLTDWY